MFPDFGLFLSIILLKLNCVLQNFCSTYLPASYLYSFATFIYCVIIFILNYFYACYGIYISFHLVAVLHVMEVCGSIMVFSVTNSRQLVHLELLYALPVHVIVLHYVDSCSCCYC